MATKPQTKRPTAEPTDNAKTEPEAPPLPKGSALQGIKDGNALTNKLKVLPATALKLAFVGPGKRVFECIVTPDVQVSDITNDAFLTHVAEQLKPWDEIEVRWINRTRRATLVVHSAGKVWAKTHLANEVKMGGELAGVVPDGYTIDFAGNSWRVIREDGHVVLKDGFDLEREALAWLRTFLT